MLAIHALVAAALAAASAQVPAVPTVPTAPPTVPETPATPAAPAAPTAPTAPTKPVFPPPGDATPKKPTFPPKTYACTFTKTPIEMDGKLDEVAWAAARWTDDFIDIQGPELPAPRYATRVKMLWDDTYLYIGAVLEEPHIWATLRKHDDIVFRDNDFEIFIDPNGDAREYYELEVNALGTIFDLYLYRRYKDDGPAEHGWNCEGLKTAIHINGTLNDPSDSDRSWSLEWAIPWSSLKPPAWERPGFGEKERGAAVPKAGDEWRINFSRVQWRHNWEGKTAPRFTEKPIDNRFNQDPPKPGADDGRPKYEKVANTPEDNWVWTPQWQIDMHDPRWWGRVKFVK